MKKLVVTFRTDNEQREYLNSIFEGKVELEFLKDSDKSDYNNILTNTDILLTWNPSRELYNVDKKSLSKVKFVQLLSAGNDHIDFNMFRTDCKMTNNKGAYAEPMAEHILTMILAIYKNLFENHKKLSDGEFNQTGLNRLLKNSVCGILGFGGIGKAAASLLEAFGTKIYAINTSGKTNEKVEFIGTLNDLDYVLKNSDVIVISLPLNKKTSGLINKNKFELMKADAVLINVARGEIIVEKDLYNHLKSHPEFSAGIDAWWIEPFTDRKFEINYPFFELPNLLGSPHNSALVPGIFLYGIKKAANNILKFIEGKEVETVHKEKSS